MTSFQFFTVNDLSLFADLGTAPPRVVSSGPNSVVRMARNGREIELVLHPDGAIQEHDEDGDRRHVDARALLASPNFGDLGRWADAQKAFLSVRIATETIPISGVLSANNQPIDVDGVDTTIIPSDETDVPRLRILLVDGPAGIGKTSLIRALAFRRAAAYRHSRRPLILHVESRGRMLQNIMDLMAFSLQTLRVNVTYDQVPVLVRYGLVTLAIDGFDELADPNGYELAWAQVNELVTAARGHGSLVLAGRETFIGRERLIEALSAFRRETDTLDTYTIQPITPNVAKGWLRKQGWADAVFDQGNMEPLFEPGSYALRPFFLYELAREGVRDKVESGAVDDLMWFLVETMIHREATKFGADVEAVTTKEGRVNFLLRFLGEVARDLAENQTDAIASDSLAWLAEVAAADLVPLTLIGILKNRAGVVAFLTDDDRRGYKRFSHAQLLNHFLSRITIDALLIGDVPKYIRRNIIGADFLASFGEVLRHVDNERISSFVTISIARINELGDLDRSRRNLGTLVILTMGALDQNLNLILSDVSIDEALVIETVSILTLKRVVIAQLDARGADLRAFSFDAECHVFSLIADVGTRLPLSLPRPRRIQLPDRVLTDPTEIAEWLPGSLVEASQAISTDIPEHLRNHGIIELIGRACRYRPFWMRDGEEKVTRRILQDPYWETLRQLLMRHELLTVRHDVPASGQAGVFFHIRRKDDILAHRTSDARIRAFYDDVMKTMTNASGE